MDPHTHTPLCTKSNSVLSATTHSEAKSFTKNVTFQHIISQIPLISAQQNREMLRLPQCQIPRGPAVDDESGLACHCSMKKEPLLYLSSLWCGKKGSVVSIKLKCDDEQSRVVLYRPRRHYTPISSKSSRFHKTLKLNMNFRFYFKGQFLSLSRNLFSGALKVTATPLSLKLHIQSYISAGSHSR